MDFLSVIKTAVTTWHWDSWAEVSKESSRISNIYTWTPLPRQCVVVICPMIWFMETFTSGVEQNLQQLCRFFVFLLVIQRHPSMHMTRLWFTSVCRNPVFQKFLFPPEHILVSVFISWRVNFTLRFTDTLWYKTTHYYVNGWKAAAAATSYLSSGFYNNEAWRGKKGMVGQVVTEELLVRKTCVYNSIVSVVSTVWESAFFLRLIAVYI